MILVFRPDAGEALAIFGRALPADRVGDSSLRHEVSLVARIEENLRTQAITLRSGDFLDHRAFLQHSSALSQALSEEHPNGLRIGDHIVQRRFGDLWLGIPPKRHS